MPRNRLRVCTAWHLLPAKTGTRIPRVVLIYLKTHERRHMRYSLLAYVSATGNFIVHAEHIPGVKNTKAKIKLVWIITNCLLCIN